MQKENIKKRETRNTAFVLLAAVIMATANTAFVIGAVSALTDAEDGLEWAQSLMHRPMPASCIWVNTSIPDCLPGRCFCVTTIGIPPPCEC